MIDAYLEKSPAAMKVPLFLEEAGLDYRITHISVGDGHQHSEAFRAISPNDKVPAIVDHDPVGGGAPLSLFESGAILLYLAEKTGRFVPTALRARAEMMQWLFWQASGLSPMSGQLVHFSFYAPEAAKPYGHERYRNEVNRLYGVLNRRLAAREFICGEYGIADMATYPWINLHLFLGQSLQDFPHLSRWGETIATREAVVRAYARAKQEMPDTNPSPEALRKNLFGHTAKSLGLV